jgi:hypothetical protein
LKSQGAKTAYVIGDYALIGALEDEGINFDSDNPEYVVIGETSDYNYDKIKLATLLVNKGAKLIGTNTDLTAPTEEGIVPANTEIRLIDLLLRGGSINYKELGEFVQQFKCGASMLKDSVIGTTLTVELRLYEVTDKADSNTNSWNEETGEYLTVCTYRYTFK